MGSVGALGIGLSVVFSVFLILFLAELYYLVFWKRKSLLSSSRVNSVAPDRNPGGDAGGDVAEEDDGGGDGLKIFESRMMSMGSDGECILAPPRLLFTIKEETREDLDHEEKQQQQRRMDQHVVLQVAPPFLFKNSQKIDDCSSPSISPSPSSLSSSNVRDSSSSLSSISNQRHRSSSCSSDGDELVSAMDVRSEATEEEESSTPFMTPPSSPGFSSPSQSPPASPLRQMQVALPINHRSGLRPINPRYSSCSSRSNTESPPLSPLLVPIPVIASNHQTSLRMEELLSRNASSSSARGK